MTEPVDLTAERVRRRPNTYGLVEQRELTKAAIAHLLDSTDGQLLMDADIVRDVLQLAAASLHHRRLAPDDPLRQAVL